MNDVRTVLLSAAIVEKLEHATYNTPKSYSEA
jgi:hypothetical protein